MIDNSGAVAQRLVRAVWALNARGVWACAEFDVCDLDETWAWCLEVAAEERSGEAACAAWGEAFAQRMEGN